MSDKVIIEHGGQVTLTHDATSNSWFAHLPNNTVAIGKGATMLFALRNLVDLLDPKALNSASRLTAPAPSPIGNGMIRVVSTIVSANGKPACVVIYGIDEKNPQAAPSVDSFYDEEGGMASLEISDGTLATAIAALKHYQSQGDTLISWGATRFDFRLMSVADQEMASEVARAHYDIGFQFLALKGFLIPFTTALASMNVEYTPDQDLLENTWAVDPGAAIDAALRNTAAVASLWRAIVENRFTLDWQTRQGKDNRTPFGKMNTVAESMKLRVPDTSWMKDPMTRADVTAWMSEDTDAGMVAPAPAAPSARPAPAALPTFDRQDIPF